MALKPLYLSYTCNTIIAASLQSVLNYKNLPIMCAGLFRAKRHRGSPKLENIYLVEKIRFWLKCLMKYILCKKKAPKLIGALFLRIRNESNLLMSYLVYKVRPWDS